MMGAKNYQIMKNLLKKEEVSVIMDSLGKFI